MSEIRRDRTNGAWVIIAPERSLRPHGLHHDERGKVHRPSFDPACPFCPGNEHLLAGLIEETGSGEPPGWRTRVVPNKYPALSPAGGPAPASPDAGSVLPGYGHHEVIIETSRHDTDLARLSGPDLDAVMRIYRRRYIELMAQPGIKSVTLFRNHGRGGGASLAHPHSQVLAIGMIPPRHAVARAWAHSYHAREGRCVTCDEIKLELKGGQRVVEVTERFLVAVPFAAAGAFELWILPRRHQASFAECCDEDLVELGPVLRRALNRLEILLDDPPYNFAIESAAAEDAGAPFIHWRLRILPGVVTPGGFELGTGLPINPSRPEESALMLRATPAEREDAGP